MGKKFVDFFCHCPSCRKGIVVTYRPDEPVSYEEELKLTRHVCRDCSYETTYEEIREFNKAKFELAIKIRDGEISVDDMTPDDFKIFQ